MRILAHRGYWKTKEEQNTVQSFEKALNMGFGIETDIRDCDGTLVISHDPPSKDSLKFEELLKLYNESGSKEYLALNLKSDGLQYDIRNLLIKYNITRYFVFDMSTPEIVQSDKLGLTFFTRHSSIEAQPVLYDGADGVWLDDFSGDWISSGIVSSHLDNQKLVAIISEELHRRPYQKKWEYYKKNLNAQKNQKLFLCTDLAVEANVFFNGE